MKKSKILLVGLVVALMYPACYSVLRLSKYFVRQKFVTFVCPVHIRDKYPDDARPIQDGYTSYSFESERNQIGCGSIQKNHLRFGEAIILPVFRPLGEIEMRIRGFTHSEMLVLMYVAEFERYGSDSNKVYFHRESLVDRIPISRKDQTF